MSVSSTIIKGNIVTPSGVLYGGHIEIIGDTIVTVEDNNSVTPNVNEMHKVNGQEVHVAKVVESPWVIPGFVDIHNHGAGGAVEMSDNWLFPEFTLKYLAQVGTTSVLSSLLFPKSHMQTVKKVIERVEFEVRKVRPNSAVIEGIHAEGPCLMDFGGQPTPDADISLEKFKELCSWMPHMKVMTIAASRESHRNYERMRHLLDIDCRISMGHDRQCQESDILGALRVSHDKEAQESSSGKSKKELRQKYRMHSTHMYNVMNQHHRNPSLINFLLCDHLPSAGIMYENLQVPTVELIGDLIHVHPVVLQSVFSCRKPHDICMITDCVSTYEPGKQMKYNGRIAAVRAEGGVYLLDNFGRSTQTLAGSCSLLSDQFYTLITCFRLDIVTVCLFLSTNAARFAKIEHVGSLAVGKKANILLLNGQIDSIMDRMIYGMWVEGKPHKMKKPTAAHI